MSCGRNDSKATTLKLRRSSPLAATLVSISGPLKAGTYLFFDDFHEDQTKGTLIAK